MKVLVAVSFISSFKILDFFFKLISNHFYVVVSIFFYCSKLKLFSTSKIAFKKAGKNIKLRKIKANTVYSIAYLKSVCSGRLMVRCLFT